VITSNTVPTVGPAKQQVAMGLIFYPRGGSAQVARYLSRALDGAGWEVSLACGSLGAPGTPTHAATFFDGLRVTAADYGPAIDAFAAGRDPLEEPVPMHPSFEDGGDTADRVFAAVSPRIGAHLVAAWERILADGWTDPTLFHLHHLTPLQAAVHGRWPGRPVLTHLHGTELKMIDRIDRLADLAAALDTTLAGMAEGAQGATTAGLGGLSPEQRDLFESTDWAHWRFGAHWAELLGELARRSDRIVVISPHDRDEALRLLGVDRGRIELMPNGVDTERFDRRVSSPEERLSRWRRWLVADPRGWDESGEPGSIRYDEQDLRAFVDRESGEPSPVLLYVGRFLDFKRVPMLVRAYARARPRFARPAPLVIWGGSPGEWDGEHPHTVARREGADGIFFVGWRGHDELPDGLACADAFVAPSTNEPFGLVLLEAMASGLPVIATRSGGPLTFVNTESGRPNGWMIEPDDVEALADALVEAVNDVEGRRERGENAYQQIRAAYSWRVLAERLTATYEALAG
jgi:glycosyltransferase involved in cell wall biosynthesis